MNDRKDFSYWFLRLGPILFIVLALLAGTITSYSRTSNDVKDPNVYLDEETCYAGGIYIKANKISVIESKEEYDEDGDKLSPYTLRIGISIQRRGGNFWTGVNKIRSNNFTLKSVNLESKSKMGVFIECLFKATVSAAIDVALGDVNIIGETLNFVEEYTLESIENAQNSSVDFKPIKCSKGQFEPYKPKDGDEPREHMLEFPIKQEYLESKNLIVLAIDQATHVEQRIFLTKRPNLS